MQTNEINAELIANDEFCLADEAITENQLADAEIFNKYNGKFYEGLKVSVNGEIYLIPKYAQEFKQELDKLIAKYSDFIV